MKRISCIAAIGARTFYCFTGRENLKSHLVSLMETM